MTDIYKQAVARWGEVRQLRQTQEECAELTVAISHWLRLRPGALEQLVEEIADVEIMLSQLRTMPQFAASVERAKNLKLQRLQEMIDAG